MDDMTVMPPSVPVHEHDSGDGGDAQTAWNVATLKQYLDSELRAMYAQRTAVDERIEVEIRNIHNEITIRDVSSEKAIDKAIQQVTLSNEAAKRDAEQKAAAVLEAVNTLAKTNEARFAKQEELSGAVATLRVQLDATRRESAIINESNQLAINKAETANEKRFDSVNGLRNQLSDQATTFMPRELAESKISEATNTLAGRITSIEKTITDLRSWRDTQSGQGQGATQTKDAQRDNTAMLFTGIMAVIAVVSAITAVMALTSAP